MCVSHLCPAKRWVEEEAEDLHLLRAAQDSFAAQHPEPQTTAYAAWQEAAQRQLFLLSILGLQYFTKLEPCFYKAWFYSFLVVNLTTDWLGLLFSSGSTAQWFRVWKDPFKNLGMGTRDYFWKWPKHPTIAIAASWGVTYTEAEQATGWA